LQWEREIRKEDKVLTTNTKEIFDDAKAKPIEVTQIEKKKLAENEKLKGNELMKTKEFDQAIKLYTQSIKYDSTEPTTYCNRALAYSKVKQYDNAISDCTKAISLKDDYTKAYYRRAVCYMEIHKHKEAFTDLLIVLRDTPDSQEVINEINNLKNNWKNHIGKDEYHNLERVIEEEIEMAKKRHKKPVKQENGFKKIKIVEETVVENKELSNFIIIQLRNLNNFYRLVQK
jgi:tetratricopeptide (TPR) repeat protein